MYLFCLSYKSATTPATCSRLVRASRLPACTACSSTALHGRTASACYATPSAFSTLPSSFTSEASSIAIAPCTSRPPSSGRRHYHSGGVLGISSGSYAQRFFIVGSTLAIRLRHRVDFLHAQQVRAGLYLLLCLLQVEATHAVLYLVFVAAQRAVHLVQQAGIDIR